MYVHTANIVMDQYMLEVGFSVVRSSIQQILFSIFSQSWAIFDKNSTHISRIGIQNRKIKIGYQIHQYTAAMHRIRYFGSLGNFIR